MPAYAAYFALLLTNQCLLRISMFAHTHQTQKWRDGRMQQVMQTDEKDGEEDSRTRRHTDTDTQTKNA